MSLFISWSGPESKKIAGYVHAWLDNCFHKQLPSFISTKDIKVGDEWFGELKEALEKSTACLICLTPDNLKSEWIHFEIGAAAHTKKGFKILSIIPNEVIEKLSPPLSNYQVSDYSENGFKALYSSLMELHPNPPSIREANQKFDEQWPELKSKLEPHLKRFEDSKFIIDNDVKILTRNSDVIKYNMKIVQEAEERILTTGSRSRNENYLETIEQKLSQNPNIVHWRVLINNPHHQVFKDHLIKLFDYRDPKDRSLGEQKLFISLCSDTHSDPERFICANEKEALIVLPSFTFVNKYDTALVISNPEAVSGIINYVNNLHLKSQEIKTKDEIEALGLYEGQ